jgi:CheY-like chemotaxis protein
MPEEEIEKTDESAETPDKQPKASSRRGFVTRRRLALAAGILAVLVILLGVVALVLYRTGVGDSYVKNQFVTKMDEIGVVFDADVFRLTIAPLELELKNATFNDKITGEKLFFVRDARLGLSVKNLYSWQLSRDISIDKTEVNGAEAWVKFDENGRSNFANLKLVEDQPGVRKAMQMLLKIEGFHVIAAATAAEAIERLGEDADFDLLITDYHLESGRTGTEVIAAARKVLGASLKAILVTGDTSSAVRELQADANLRITSKPVNSEELLGLVKALLII